MADRNYFIMLDHIGEGTQGGKGATIRVGNIGEKGFVAGPDGVEWEQTIHVEDRKKAVQLAVKLRNQLRRPLHVHSVWAHVEPELYKMIS